MIAIFKHLILSLAALCCAACAGRAGGSPDFIRTDGVNLVDGNGNRFEIRGTNLGHWLNPRVTSFSFPKAPIRRAASMKVCASWSVRPIWSVSGVRSARTTSHARI